MIALTSGAGGEIHWFEPADIRSVSPCKSAEHKATRSQVRIRYYIDRFDTGAGTFFARETPEEVADLRTQSLQNSKRRTPW